MQSCKTNKGSNPTFPTYSKEINDEVNGILNLFGRNVNNGPIV
jgi:hypothetical protein